MSYLCENASPIVVIGVNEINFNEITSIINHLDNPQLQIIKNIEFVKGEINHYPVVVAKTSPHKIAASVTTVIAYQHFHPKYIINVGSAGGHHVNIHINDIILGKNIIDLDSYRGDATNPSKRELLSNILHDDNYLLNIANNIYYQHGNIKLGTIGTTDTWNTNVNLVTDIHNQFKEDCEEMESYAISQVAEMYLIPHLNIRIISNNITNGEQYDPNTNKYAQDFTCELLERLTK